MAQASNIQSVEIPLDAITVDCESNHATCQSEGKIDAGHRLKLTYIKLLKLYFTPVTQAALKMVHCVKLWDSYHLFVYGPLICYNKWQLAIVTIILPGVLLFPVCLVLSLRLLKEGLVTSSKFVAAIACPYYALIIQLQQRFKTQETINNISVDEQEFAKRVLEGEEELYVVDEKSLGWQVVQLYRTIVINLITIFITIPFYRLLTLVPVLFVFFLHDRYRQPYKNGFLNRLQSLSSGCLLIVLNCNLLASMSFMADISSVEFVDLVVDFCGIVEMISYVAVPMYLPILKLWNVYKNRKNRKDK